MNGRTVSTVAIVVGGVAGGLAVGLGLIKYIKGLSAGGATTPLLDDEDIRAHEAGHQNLHGSRFSVGNHGSFPLGTGPDTRLTHHQLVALSRLSPEDRKILLDYMDDARGTSPQWTASYRDILNAWSDLDKGTFESTYKGPIDETVVQSWSSAYGVLIDSMKRARWLAPSSVGADYVP